MVQTLDGLLLDIALRRMRLQAELPSRDADFVESEHPRDEGGKFDFASGGGGAGITDAEWQTWAESGYDISAAKKGELKAGDLSSADGSKLNEAAVASLVNLHDRIHDAAIKGRVAGGAKLHRGVSFETVAEMDAAMKGKPLVHADLTSTSPDEGVALEYATHNAETYSHAAPAVIHYESGNGIQAAEARPFGEGGQEYILPKGSTFGRPSYQGLRDGVHHWAAYSSKKQQV